MYELAMINQEKKVLNKVRENSISDISIFNV